MHWRQARHPDSNGAAKRSTTGMPLARKDELVVEEVGDEVLVYDQRVHRAHCLSTDAARVWRECDGRDTPARLAERLSLDEATVARALDELAGCDLLADSPQQATGSTRREVAVRFAKVGAAAASVPLIVSVAAPMAHAAATVNFCASSCPAPCNSGSCGSCCTSAFAGCGCCNCGGNPKFCTPVGPPGNQNQICVALHGAGCNITCTG